MLIHIALDVVLDLASSGAGHGAAAKRARRSCEAKKRETLVANWLEVLRGVLEILMRKHKYSIYKCRYHTYKLSAKYLASLLSDLGHLEQRDLQVLVSGLTTWLK